MESDVLLQPLGLAVVGIGLYLLLYKADLLSVVFHMSYIQDTVIIVIVCGAAIPLLGLFGLVATRISMFRVLAAVCSLLLLVLSYQWSSLPVVINSVSCS